jgi:hypothetical protein
MSAEIINLFIKFEELRVILNKTVDKINETSKLAFEIGGEFEQELSTDLDSIQVDLERLLDDLDSTINEAKTLSEDYIELESSLRAGIFNEENYKVNAEHIQEEMKQNRRKHKNT